MGCAETKNMEEKSMSIRARGERSRAHMSAKRMLAGTYER